MFNEIKELTKKLVGIASVNTTPGEHDIACFIDGYKNEYTIPPSVLKIDDDNESFDNRRWKGNT